MIRLISLFVAASLSSFAAVDPGLLALLPPSCQTVAAIDVESSRSSSFGQYVLNQMSQHEDSFQELVQKTGFDPRRDLQSLVIASMPPDSPGHSKNLVLARGVFDQALISSQATAKGMVQQTFAGSPILVSTSGSPTALAFPQSGLAVFGDRSAVEQVLNASHGGHSSTLSAALKVQVAAASRNNDAWFASTVPANDLVSHMPQAGDAFGNSTQKSQMMQAVLQSNGGVRFGSNVQLSFNAQTRSDKDATSLTDFIRFMSSAIQMQRQNDPRAALLAPSFDSMQLRADGRQVYTSFSIPEADLEQILSAQAKSSHHVR